MAKVKDGWKGIGDIARGSFGTRGVLGVEEGIARGIQEGRNTLGLEQDRERGARGIPLIK